MSVLHAVRNITDEGAGDIWRSDGIVARRESGFDDRDPVAVCIAPAHCVEILIIAAKRQINHVWRR